MTYKNYFKKLLLFFSFVVLSSGLVYQSHAFDSRAPFVFMYDIQSETELFAKSAHERIIPASLTKMMTSYLVMKGLENGQIKIDDIFSTSERAYNMPGSRMFLEVGQKISVANLLLGLIVQSGNDASVVLAEGVAGSEEEFARLMTKQAQELGALDTQYRNASGLPENGHYSTVYDLVMIAKALIEDYPDLYSLHKEKEFEFNGINQRNRNLLLGLVTGVDGIKTGYTSDAGYGVAISAVRSDRRIIFVAHGMQNEIERKRESERLIEWGFRAWANNKILDNNIVIYNAPVVLGSEKSVNLISRNPVYVSVPKDQSQKVRTVLRYNKPLVAPLNTETSIADIQIAVGNTIRYVRLFAETEVKEAGFFGTLWYNVRSLVGLNTE